MTVCFTILSRSIRSETHAEILIYRDLLVPGLRCCNSFRLTLPSNFIEEIYYNLILLNPQAIEVFAYGVC
jgi:hypothetical protein